MNKPLVKNAAEESQVRDAGQKVKLREDQEHNDLKFVLSNESGRRFMWKTLSDCGIFQTSFRSSGSETFFLEGKRSVGLKLLADVMQADPDSYLKMYKSNKGEN